MRKVFLDELPTKEGIGANKGKECIDWSKIEDCSVHFIYDDIDDNLIIKHKESKSDKLILEYNESEFKISYRHFLNCKLGAMLGRKSNNGLLGVNTIWDTDPWMIDLGVSEEDAKGYTSQSNKKIIVRCPECNTCKSITVSKIYNRKSIGCSCGDGFSYGHKYVYSVINQMRLNFEQNVTFEWCKFADYNNKNIISGEYDFVIESNKVIIEVDGGFHRVDNKMNGKTKEESKYIDDMKDLLAESKGYKVVRVYYNDNNMSIKDEILNSELSKICDLIGVDWNICEEYALKNIAKEVCNYWSNKEAWETTRDLMQVFKLGRNVILKYLKRGNELGWCIYNPIESYNLRYRKIIESNKNRSKPVLIYYNGVQLCEPFDSARELDNMSVELFGVKLNYKSISAACTGKLKQYKGYTFKFTE